MSYDEVKKAGYRKRAERAYEAIFAVADRTADLLEMNIILEQEGLLWKIVSEDLLDIYEPFLEAADPLNTAFVSQFTRLVEVCRDSRSDEELAWRTDRAVQENQQETFRFMTQMTAAIMLSGAIMGYELCKRAFQSWLEPEKDLRALIAQRAAARRTHEFLSRTWGWDFDTMVANEWMKVWMLVPANVDGLGRIRRVLDPHNLEAMRALLFEEILPEKSLAEILLHEQAQSLYYALDTREPEVAARYAEEAKKRNAHLIWFQYQDRLQAAAGDKLVKQPEAKQPGR
jgi:hypothetical protein